MSLLVEGCYNAGNAEGSKSGAAAGSVRKSSVNNCFVLEGTAPAVFSNIEDTDVSSAVFKDAEYMQTGEFIIDLRNDTDFVDDTYDENGGFPILSWQNERPEIYGEYQEIQLQYDSESGKYTLAQVVRPVNVHISARTFVSDKNITFDVQPAGQVGSTLNISVWDSEGKTIYPESGYFVSIRMEETIPSHKVTFESNSKYASIFNSKDDNEIFGTERVTDGSGFGFYIVPDEGYDIVSVRASNQDTALDIWDGKTTDIAWYK